MLRREDPPRSSTGSSSAESSYPIPQIPEHQSQLGDMKLVCPCQKPWKLNLKQNLVEKIPPNENAGDLLNKILEILDVKILVEHPLLNTIMLLLTLGFVLLKHYVTDRQNCIRFVLRINS